MELPPQPELPPPEHGGAVWVAPPEQADPVGVWVARFGVASIWLLTGLLVFHPGYRAVGVAHLQALGLPEVLMWATCVFEVVLGLRIVLGRHTPGLAAVQLALIVGFSGILAVSDPALLAHPFGVLTKNIPIVALILTLTSLEREGWTTRGEWVLRGGVAAIWFTEGLFPKILFQTAYERAVVAESGLVPIDPGVFLVGMGLLQIGSGVLALTLRGRWLVAVLGAQCVGLVALPVLVAWNDPSLWVHPFGPLTKNVPILVGTWLVLRRALQGALGHAPRAAFLDADWRDLVLVTYALPPEDLAPYLPPGVEVDVRDGMGYVSLVGLDMDDVHVVGAPWPGFRRFGEFNLRIYAREGDRRGVVFARELVPFRTVAWVAQRAFGEPFGACEIETEVEERNHTRRVRRRLRIGARTYQVTVEGAGPAQIPGPDTLEAFLEERYWGFSRPLLGGSEPLRFQVAHPPWAVYRVLRGQLDLDFGRVFGADWSVLDRLEPVSWVFAEGSRAQVFAQERAGAHADLPGFEESGEVLALGDS